MKNKVVTKTDTKTALIEVGTELMLQKGYTNTGIQEILQTLGVPKGSFYHYFDSKEDFGVAIIRHFGTNSSADLSRILSNKDRTPLQRLLDYCEHKKAMLAAQGCAKGCLIGNLSQEMADQSEVLRKELSDVMSNTCELFAECIEEGQSIGEIQVKHSAHELAAFFSSSWGGAVMTAKTLKTTEVFDVFIELLFKDFLKSS